MAATLVVGERTGKIWSYNVLGDQIVEAAAVAGLIILRRKLFLWPWTLEVLVLRA